MVTKLDMHLHSRGSDGTGEPADFVRAVQEAGLDGFVLTDHHKTLTGHGLHVIQAARKAGLVALVGCEYSTREGHCLCYGVDVRILDFGFYPSMQQVIDRVHEHGGAAFPSHPYRGVKETLGDRIFQLKNLTHLEVLNGQNQASSAFAKSARPEADQKASLAAERMGLARVGGSDAHAPSRIGTCYTEFQGSVRSTKDLIAALKARDHEARVDLEKVRKANAEARQFSIGSTTGRWSHGGGYFRKDPQGVQYVPERQPNLRVQGYRMSEEQLKLFNYRLAEPDGDDFTNAVMGAFEQPEATFSGPDLDEPGSSGYPEDQDEQGRGWSEDPEEVQAALSRSRRR